VEDNFAIESLIESNNILQGEIQRVRDSNRILRRVNSALRESLDSLRRQVTIAQENDENFKSMCQGDFDASVSEEHTGGLPGASYEVEPLG
jgi:hypothetical protein